MKSKATTRIFDARFALIAILAFLFYANTLNHGFALDDGLMIRDNSLTKQGISAIPELLFSDQFVGISGTKDNNLFSGSRYRPLSQIIFAIEYELFGSNTAMMHWVNVLFYLLLLFVLYKTLLLLFPSEKAGWFRHLPFLATGIFALHPIHTEVVANIKSLDEILAMLLAVLSLYFVLIYSDTKKNVMLLWAFLSFFGGLLSKENSLTFLGVIPLAIYLFKIQDIKKIIQMSFPLLGASILYFIFRYISLGFIMNSTESTLLFHNPFAEVDSITKYGMIAISWLKYLKLLFIPYPLTHDYYPFMIRETSLLSVWPLLSILLHAGILAAGIWLAIRKRIAGFAVLYYFITFSVVSNLVFNLGILLNERLMFMPSLGFALLGGLLIRKLDEMSVKQPALRKAPISLLLVAVMLYGLVAINRNRAWKDDRTLFYTDVKTSTESARCNVVAGTLLVIQAKEYSSKPERDKLYAEAAGYLQKGLKLYANNPTGWQALADIALDQQEYYEAYTNYRTAYQYDTSNVLLVGNMHSTANIALENKDLQAGLKISDELIQFNPENLDYYLIHAEAIRQLQSATAAVSYLLNQENKFKQEPRFFNKLAEFYARFTGDNTAAGENLHKAYQINPKDSQTLENLGVFYGMKGEYQQSLEYFLSAFEMNPGNSSLITNLANTYQNLGNVAEAERFRKMLP